MPINQQRWAQDDWSKTVDPVRGYVDDVSDPLTITITDTVHAFGDFNTDLTLINLDPVKVITFQLGDGAAAWSDVIELRPGGSFSEAGVAETHIRMASVAAAALYQMFTKT